MKTKLGELATYINGYAFKPQDRGKTGLPIIRIQDLSGNSHDLGFYNGKYPEKIEINDGDVLISWSASLGVYIWNRGKALLNQHIFKVVFDKKTISKDYFVYAVRYALNSMASKTHGATMKHIVKQDFDETEIPYPSLGDQKLIADTLLHIERIIELRTKQLSALDSLIKSRFVEMFGDPIIDVHKLTYTMPEVCEIIDGDRGKNYPKQEDFSESGHCLFLNAKNVTATGFQFDSCMFITKEKDSSLRNGKLMRGDIVLTTRGTLGNIAFYDNRILYEHVRINSGMVILRMNHAIISDMFFIEQFKMQLAVIKQKIASGSAQPQLPINTMNQIRLIVPPLRQQNEFSAFVEQINKTKYAIQKSLEETQLLFDSLMQTYFG